MEDQDIFHRSKISYDFLCDYNNVIDRQFNIYKKKLIKEILKELKEQELKEQELKEQELKEQELKEQEELNLNIKNT